MSGGLPLLEAYPFGKAKGLEREVEEIRNLEITARNTSAIRRGAIIKLFHSKGIFDEFIQSYWTEGKSRAGETRIRWYVKKWEDYQRYLSGESPGDVEGMESEEEEEEERAFAYENDLRNYLAKNLGLVERGLRLFKDDREGVEYPVGDKRIDILAIDQRDNFVVIELKVSRGYERAIGQLLYYMGWIQEHLAKEKSVRGMIVAREITEELKLACKRVSGVELFEYELKVDVRKA